MREKLQAKESREIQGMFGRIAHRYDLLNRLLSLGRDQAWRRLLAKRVAKVGPELVIDVCTGTADVALSFADGKQKPTSVLGTDFCLPMLARARRKIAAQGRNLPIFAADALQLPMPTGLADVVSVAFGVRNFEDLDRGLGELVRILRPGGILFILEFSRPTGPLAPLMRWWEATVPPRLGKWISGDPEAYAYLPDSVARFPSGEKMLARLEAAGLSRTQFRRLTGGVASLYEGVKE